MKNIKYTLNDASGQHTGIIDPTEQLIHQLDAEFECLSQRIGRKLEAVLMSGADANSMFGPLLGEDVYQTAGVMLIAKPVTILTTILSPGCRDAAKRRISGRILV